MTEQELPRVSLIIPFLNNHEEVVRMRKHLAEQNYPAEKMEVILVDNGSDRAFTFPGEVTEGCMLLEEYNHKNSPYSARNRGIEQATGDMFIFIDANSLPGENWLMNGIQCLLSSKSGIVAGEVEFDLGEKPSAANIVDAFTSINMRKAVAERGVAYTANLFIKKEVMRVVGMFEEGARSGGDVRWSMRAVDHGFEIDFCEKAVVKKYPRSFKALIRKRIRTGRGYLYTWHKETEKPIWFYNFLRSLKPRSLEEISRRDTARAELLQLGKPLRLWFTFYITGIIEQLAFMFEYIRYNLGSQRDIDRRKKMLQQEEKSGNE